MDFSVLSNMKAPEVLAELFDPATYRGYLQVMSRFSSYSWRNIFLIYRQMPHASKLADFNTWKEQYGRTIVRGSKGIRIYAPTPQKPKKKLVEKTDPETGAAVLDDSGKRVMEEIFIEVPPLFKPVSYMDISQTEGAPVPCLAGDVLSDEALSGAFTDVLKAMLLSSEQLDFYGMIKHIAHDRLDNADSDNSGFVVESVVYVVCRRFGVEADAEFIGLDRLLDTEMLEYIGRLTDSLITAIEDRFAVICKERGLDPITPITSAEVKPQAEPIADSTEAPKAEPPPYTKELRTEKVVGVEFEQYIVNPVTESEAAAVNEIEPAPSKPQAVTETPPPAVEAVQNKQAKPIMPREPPTLKYLPDNTITIAERNEYGYTRPELLPVTKIRAIPLFKQDLRVYLLHKDNTEAMAHYLSDIQGHDGIFGVTYGAWQNSKEYIALASGDPDAQRETNFMFYSGDAFAVYQTTPEDSTAAYKSYEELEKDGLVLNRHKYNIIYTAPLPAPPSNTPEGIFMWVNAEQPDGYNGRALAISDVLSIKKDEVITSYYANGRAFKELLGFSGAEGRTYKREAVGEVVGKAIENTPVIAKREVAPVPLALETSQPPPQSQPQVKSEPPEPPLTQQAPAQEQQAAPPSTNTVQVPPPPKEPPPQEPALPVIKSDTQVYRLSATEAEGYGATDAYELSRRLDVDCASAIAAAIHAHKKGEKRYDLVTPAESLLKDYGAERMAWVLSKQILVAANRFSEANYSWAAAFIKDGMGSGDDKPTFSISVYHAVLDAFATQFRAILVKKPTFNERMKAARKKSEAHNKAKG